MLKKQLAEIQALRVSEEKNNPDKRITPSLHSEHQGIRTLICL